MNATGSAPYLLSLKGVSKAFGANQALSGVDFEVGAGEVVALVGDNGAGKSTLVKAIAGVQLADQGEFCFQGEPVKISTPQDATALGIATVYQDLALCDNLDVVSNLYLGREQTEAVIPGVRAIDEVSMEKTAVRLLADLHVRLPSVRRAIATLSGGQRQSVAVTRAVMWDSKVVLLDEPTAALGVEQTRQVKDLIGRLRERGLALVVISHNLADVFDLCDRIIVLRLGRRVATFDIRGTNPEQVVSAITGAEFAGAPGQGGQP